MPPTRPSRRGLLAALAGATLLVALAGPVAPAAAERAYGGDSSSEELEISLAASDDGATITRISLISQLVCGGYRRVDAATSTSVAELPAAPVTDVLYLSGAAITGGRVDASLLIARPRGAGRTDVASARLTGTLTASRGQGTLRMTSRIVRRSTGQVLRTCSATLPWRVLRNPGRILAGSTSQGAPLMLRVSADGRRVTTARYGWVTPCRRVEYYFEPRDDYLLPFRLGSDGTFSQPFRYDAGQRRNVIGRFGGQVRTGSASGRLRVRIAGGGERCRLPALTWTATTG
jgi:hypothetical protein